MAFLLGNTKNMLMMVKLVLLEFSPRDLAVFVRGVWPEGKAMKLAPIHEDNTQALVRVTEGCDNLAKSAWDLHGIIKGRGETP